MRCGCSWKPAAKTKGSPPSWCPTSTGSAWPIRAATAATTSSPPSCRCSPIQRCAGRSTSRTTSFSRRGRPGGHDVLVAGATLHACAVKESDAGTEPSAEGRVLARVASGFTRCWAQVDTGELRGGSRFSRAPCHRFDGGGAMISIEGAEQALRHLRGRRTVVTGGGKRRGLRLPRPQRRRQDDDHPHAHGHPGARRRAASLIDGLDCQRDRVEVKRRVGYLPDKPIFYDYCAAARSCDSSARCTA